LKSKFLIQVGGIIEENKIFLDCSADYHRVDKLNIYIRQKLFLLILLDNDLLRVEIEEWFL